MRPSAYPSTEIGELNRLYTRDGQVWWATKEDDHPYITVHARKKVEPTKRHGSNLRLDVQVSLASAYQGPKQALEHIAGMFDDLERAQ